MVRKTIASQFTSSLYNHKVSMSSPILSNIAGDVQFNGVDFNGTLQVGTQHDDDFVGLVFSYQNNRQFYLISWKQSDQVYWEMKPFRASAIRGIQIKVILTRYKSTQAKWPIQPESVALSD